MGNVNLIELIKSLRERTGAGMMDCKRALIASNNDEEKAIEWLREKGIAKSAAKASRIAAEGLGAILINGNEAVIAEINCETDFVAKSDKFQELTKKVLEETMSKKPANIDEAREICLKHFSDATMALGEKLDYRRFEILTKKDDECFGSYLHMGGKIASLLVLSKENAELAKGLAMHIAANQPSYITKDDIPESVVRKETEIALKAAEEDEKLRGKPQNILEKIIGGKVSKTLAETTLVEQVYLIDGEKKVGQVLSEAGVKVMKFVRYAVGEGIAKVEE